MKNIVVNWFKYNPSVCKAYRWFEYLFCKISFFFILVVMLSGKTLEYKGLIYSLFAFICVSILFNWFLKKNGVDLDNVKMF